MLFLWSFHWFGKHCNECAGLLGCVMQSVACLTYPIALKKAKIVYNFGLSGCNRVKHQKPRIQCLARPHTFVFPSTDSRRAVVSYWRKYVLFVLVKP